MAIFDATASSEDVTGAFAQEIKGRTFLITGAGQPSIGSKMATSLAKFSPAHIIIASRTAKKVEPVLEEIKQSSVKATFVQVDLSDHDSVRQAAKEILAVAPKINVLINSAGNMALKEFMVDKQGIEMQFSGNHVGHFLLTNLLVPALTAAARESETGNARVVNLTSSGYLISPVRFEDWNYSDGKEYDPWTGYGQAKSANILFAYGLTKRLKARGITAVAAHPGYNGDTQLGAHLTWDDYGGIFPATKKNTGRDFEFEEPRFKSYTQIAATPLIAALDPELPAKSPAYLQNSQVAETGTEYVRDDESVEKLWKLSEKLVGEKFEY